MKRSLLFCIVLIYCAGCGATAQRHVVTLSDVDDRLADSYGADLRWYDLAQEHTGFDRDAVSNPDSMTVWVDLCGQDCDYVEQHYTAFFEDVAHAAFIAEQMRTVAHRSDRAHFERLARFGARYVTVDRLRTLKRRLAMLQPEVDFARQPAKQRVVREALQQAERQLAEVRQTVPTAAVVIAEAIPPSQPVPPVRVYPVSAIATANVSLSE